MADARGQNTELDQFTVAPTVGGNATDGFTVTGGTSHATRYGYDAAGLQNKVTGPDNAVWGFGYDLLGRKTSQADPDAGASHYGFDDAGNLVSTTDSRNNELDFTYDLLGRKLTETDKAKNFKVASWLYDSLRIGQLTSSTSYVQGVTGGYTVATTGYTTLGKSTGTKITLPTSEAPLPASYQTTYTYTPKTQLLATQADPRTQGLNNETITYGHDVLGNPTTTASSIQTYVGGTVYTNYGQPSQLTLGASTNPAWITYSYDDQTRKPTERLISRTQAPGPQVDDTTYSYDAAGNPLTTADQQSETGNTVKDTQCYQYDALARLSQAWTAKTACPAQGTDPTAATVAGTAGSYWQSYSYNAIGDRTQVVDHSTTGGADVTTGYVEGCTTGCNATGAQPHTLTKTTGGSNPADFVYDAAGNLLTRTPTGSGAGQSLTWDDEGHLAQVDTTGSSAGTTKYVYDADGNQLIRRDPGKTTLFAGDTEIVVNTGVTPNVLLGAVRTYAHGGAGSPVAVRSSLPGGGTDYLFDDPHGTGTMAMDTTTQKVSRQQYTPYGQQRANANDTPWADPTHSFLGKSQEAATGYTDVGVRKYDPALGRFISVDPKFEATDPQELGGYAYAGDNPVTNADPSGQMYPADMGPGPSYRPPTDATDWLFRGTTEGFGGSANIQSTGSTPTSSDPGVSTHFATQAANDYHGQGVLHILNRQDLVELEIVDNYYQSIPHESEVWVEGSATDLAKRARVTIPVEQARSMLSKMGIDVDPSTRLGDLDDNLIKTPKLTPAQIEDFAKNAGATGGSGSGAASTASKLAGSAGGDAGFITVGGALKGSLFVGAVALSAYDVAKAPPAQRLHTATRDAAGLAGGLAGATYGAEVGASIGSAIPGAGTVIGGVVGGVVGGLIGSGVASDVADKVMNWF